MAISTETAPGRLGLVRLRRLLQAGTLVGAIAAMGCGQTQVAAEHRELVLQLATAGSTRDAAMMDRVAAEVDRLAAASELSDAETTAFGAIIAAARANDWDRARDLAYALRDGQHPTAEDQERVAKRTLREIKKPGSAKGRSH